ncbi:HEAT repeat containing protein [Pyrenophora tritici-repentis Pt-1C-BFP]|uniref:HEAT repeat containing protein n=1 Tax=Pyrenophora tritici-repentis (strain Pt-1C-BFP) TaxID=426418 RepID=B2W3Q5_PYRTR|nr:HEAT repeat containing protein [Pyrenophora tritici-repentis Pt-1C-BFP]EDU48012.1 HEAT repeat containing protein [Pyrenophora tritici-repentis Pt-1C-BFP]
MEKETSDLLKALQKPSTDVQSRLALFSSLKSSIKHNRVPENCQAPIFECIRIACTAATSAALVSTGFSTLSHFIKRLQLQKETSILTSQSSVLCAILADKLGDGRESHRTAASQILADLHYLFPMEIDALIHEAVKSTNPRAKESAMLWVVKMNQTEGLPFKSYSNQLVANLEDADAGVRDVAKKAVVELFGHAPEHAKANLKKQLIALNVRKAIATYITSHLDNAAISKDAEVAPPPPVAPVSRPIMSKRAETLQPDVGFADEQPPPAEVVVMDPIHIYTQRELDDIFRDMAPHYEGKESEGNWLARDKNCTKLRRILKGNAPHEFHGAFVVGIKSLLDGILKVSNSLRTTMSTNGCLLVQELAKTLGSAIDPWTEILLQSFIKMCAATKNIAAQNGAVTVDTIFQNVSYSSRLLQHVAMASQDKNVQPRTHSATWAKTLIRRHTSHIEHSGGLETLDTLIRRGVTDANPKVREAYRSAYWTFALVWPQRAERMFDTLDKREKTALEKDPNNPNASMTSSQVSTASFSKSVGPGASRSALKEKIAEQRRAKLAAAKAVPERPNSAAATYTTPGKPQLALNKSMGTGSLMSGTVRRRIRPPRPELNRPATADPYAVRRPGKVTPSMTPEKTPATSTVKKSGVPKTTARPRSQTQNSPNVSSARPKSRIGQPVAHRKSASISSRQESPAVSPAKEKEEDLTMVKPWVRSQSHHDPGTIPFRQRNGLNASNGSAVVDHDTSISGDEDNFTMVIPTLTRPTAQPTHRTPPKPTPSSGRLPVPSPRASLLRSPKSMSHLDGAGFRSSTRSPRMKSPDRPSTRGTDAGDEVQVYEDPFVGEEPSRLEDDANKSVLEELPINEKSNERRQSTGSIVSDVMMGNGSEERPRGHYKTGSTGSVLHTESYDTNNAEVLKNRQLLASGIKKIEGRTVEAHMFRRMQDMVKSNQEIWGPNDENFGRLLLACLDFLEAPVHELKAPQMKAVNLKVQALATIRALLSLYRKETSRYFSRVLRTVLATKAQYENTSHIAMDLESTADEIVKYGQTLDCLNTVLAMIEDTPASTPTSSPNSKSSVSSLPGHPSTRTTTMALSTLASLVEISGAKNVALSPEQTARLGRLAVRCMDDQDADVRKADIEFCVALHERINGSDGAKEDGGFWKAVAGAREQHLNLLTYYLAKKAKA